MSSFDWTLPTFTPPVAPGQTATSTGSLLGKGLAFPLRMDPVTNDFQRAVDEVNVEMCLRALLFTAGNERWDALVGTVIPDLLFEDADAAPDLAQPSILATIQRNEPRVRIGRLAVQAKNYAGGAAGIVIALAYVIRATGRRKSLVAPYILPSGGAQ